MTFNNCGIIIVLCGVNPFRFFVMDKYHYVVHCACRKCVRINVLVR